MGYTDEDLKEINERDSDSVKNAKESLGYFILYENLFSIWLSKGKDFGIEDVQIALSAFERLIDENHKKVFEGIFNTLQTGLSKLGDTTASQTNSVKKLINLIRDIPMDESQEYDVLGFIYEYLIEKFAANSGKKAGEFYTPHEVSVLMSEIVADYLKDKDRIEIYNPTSGFRVIIMTQANSQVNTKILELLPKFKIKKMNRWCAV